MALPEFPGFEFSHVGQVETPPGWTPEDAQRNLDSRDNDLQAHLDLIIQMLNGTTPGASGADNIGAASIDGLNGNTPMALLRALKVLTDSNYSYLYNLIQGVTLGQIPPKTITGDKIADEVMFPIIRELADIQAVLAIDSQAQLNTGKYYDLFTGDNTYSCALMDATKTNLKNAADVGATSFDVVGATGIAAGREFTVQDDVSMEDVMIQSVVGNTLTTTAPLVNSYKKNAVFYRSNAVIDTTAQTLKIGSWLDFTAEIE